MLRLLITSLAREFYQQHAGFFLIGIYILFGAVEPSQLIGYQKALLLASISSPYGMVIVFVSWFLYAIKVHFFVKQRLASAKYNFIKEIGGLQKNIQFKLWLKLYSVILLPIIIYVPLLIGLSVNYKFFINIISILIIFSALTFSLIWFAYQFVTFSFLGQERRRPEFRIKIKKPFATWPIFYLIKEQPLMLLMCKVLSLVFFKSILWMFADIGNDIRILLLALLASVLCHAVLIFTLLKFETEYLNFSKCLPISMNRRLWYWVLVFGIILIPEWIFVITASCYDLYSIANSLLFGLSGLFFLLTVLYIVKLNMENYLKWLMFFFFITMWSVVAHYYLFFSLILLASCQTYYLVMFNKTDLRGENI